MVSFSGVYTESPNMDETPDLRLVRSKEGDSTNPKKADEALRPMLAPPPGGGGMAASCGVDVGACLKLARLESPLEGEGKKDANQSDI